MHEICGIILNAINFQIRKSIIGTTQVSLSKFTYDCAEKYRHGKGSAEALGEGYLARAVILVCVL